MKKRFFVLFCAVILPLLLPTLMPGRAGAQREPTPKPAVRPAENQHARVKMALHELELAKRELEQAPAIYAGHRVEALKHVDQAIEECKVALGVAEKPAQKPSGKPPAH